jgi:GAF domain-containing protein
MDSVAESAARVCAANDALIYRIDDKILRIGALYGIVGITEHFRVHGQPLTKGTVTGRAVLERRTVHVPDLTTVLESEFPHARPYQQQLGFRTALATPLLKEGVPLGAILIRRMEVKPFTDKQIALLETFADQAVIAIENTRLFDEAQSRNTELRVPLEQQTATSELLKVIGRSTFDLQPVFESLAENAVTLCEAERAFIFRFDGRILRAVASHNASPELVSFIERHPVEPARNTITGRAAFERRTIYVHDVLADPEYNYGARKVDPYRTMLAIPMLKADELLGVIVIYRHEDRPFTDGQIALMETFADQAVIAIDNVRLFEQVQARNRDLTALGEVGRAVSSTLDLKLVLKTIVERAVSLSGTDAGSIFYFRENIGKFQLGEATGLDEEVVARFRKLDIAAGKTGLGEAIANREPLKVADIRDRPSNPLRDAAIEAGFRAALIVPLLSGNGPLGALVLQRRRGGDFAPAVVSLMRSFADQSAIALENAHLFEEIA